MDCLSFLSFSSCPSSSFPYPDLEILEASAAAAGMVAAGIQTVEDFRTALVAVSRSRQHRLDLACTLAAAPRKACSRDGSGNRTLLLVRPQYALEDLLLLATRRLLSTTKQVARKLRLCRGRFECLRRHANILQAGRSWNDTTVLIRWCYNTTMSQRHNQALGRYACRFGDDCKNKPPKYGGSRSSKHSIMRSPRHA